MKRTLPDASLECNCLTSEEVIEIAGKATQDFVNPQEMLSDLHDARNGLTWIRTSIHNDVRVIVKKSRALTGVLRESMEAKAMRAACGHLNIAKLYGDAIVDMDGSIASLKVPTKFEGRPKSNETQHLIIVMEYLTPSYGGQAMPNLYSKEYCDHKGLSSSTIFAHLCKHISEAMHHLYTHEFLHGDIKLRNTAFEIVNNEIVFKLIDFGSATVIKRGSDGISIGWDVDKMMLREMIMSILTWGILPERNTTKRLFINNEYAHVVGQDGKRVETPLPFEWLATDKIITYVRAATIPTLKSFAQKERTYINEDSKKTSSEQTSLMTMKIDNTDTYFVDRKAAF